MDALTRTEQYWTKRFEQLTESQLNKGADFYANLADQYEKAAAAVQKDIDVWYARFARNQNITLTEAKRMLTTRELKEFKWTVEEYIEKGKTLNYSDRWAKQLENASARFHVSRLEALQIQMQQQAEMLHGYELDGLDRLAERIYSDGYYQTAYAIQKGVGVGWDFMKLGTNHIKQVISKPWAADGSNFSARIWKSRSQLVATLNDTLVQSIIRGKNPARTLDAIKKRFDVSRHQAGRLIMTESAFFATAGQRDAFNALDVEQYQIVATLDRKTSEVCRALDGKVLPMSDFKPGVTAPPFHAFCRTCTVPYFEDDIGERAARDADGKYYTVPSTMTYKEWAKKQNIVHEESPRKASAKPLGVDWGKVESESYREKLEKLSDNPKAVDAIETRARWMLNNNDGKRSEELYAVDLGTGKEVARIVGQKNDYGVARSASFEKKLKEADKNKASVLLMHNHPRGLPPSITDINLLLETKNVVGITVGHNGSIYKYTRPEKTIRVDDFAIALKHFSEYTEVTAMEKALQLLSKQFGFSVERL